MPKRTIEGKTKMDAKLTLLYFNIKGMAEPIRVYAHYAGVPLEDYRFADRDEFMKMKESGELPFGQVPLLKVERPGKPAAFIVQSNAILRYMSRVAGAYPDDPVAAAQVDMILDQQQDAFIGKSVVAYTTRFGISFEGRDEWKAECKQAVVSEVIPRHLKALEAMLEASGTGWLAGGAEPSVADFAWWGRIEALLNDPNWSVEVPPRCRALFDKVQALDKVQEYYAAKK